MASVPPKSQPPVRGGLPEVEAYLASLAEDARPLMQQIRQRIRSVAPDAEEVLSYGMPAFRQAGQRFIYYAAWQKHCSVYGLTGSVLDQFQAEVKPYLTPKGMLKFELEHEIPTGLIEKLVRARLAELETE